MQTRFRSCDKFGSAIQLNHAGETKFGTMSGGIVSICVYILILTFFGIRSMTVVNYEDPTLSSFTVMEDRSKMLSPISLADYHQRIYFSFQDLKSLIPKVLDARIGKFHLSLYESKFSAGVGFTRNTTDLPFVPVNETNIGIASSFGCVSDLGGLYTAADHN